MHAPTEAQQKVIDYVGNAVVSAKPGSGKTFTMAKMIAASTQKLLSYQGVIAISYTRKASAELESRSIRFGARRGLSFFGTIDGFCLGEIVSEFSQHVTGRLSEITIVDELRDYPELEALDEPWTDKENDRWLYVKAALDAGVLPLSGISEAAYCILKYVPAARAFVKSRYVAVYVDEYQDCGLAQHLLVRELVSLGLVGVVFGDLDQAIFAYDNRSAGYFEELIADPEFETFEITENHRCHKSIVEYSLRLLGNTMIREQTEERRVIRVSIDGDEAAIAQGITYYLDGICKKYSVEKRNEVALLSTSNPMLTRYQQLLGIPVKLFTSTKLDAGFSRRRSFIRDLLSFLYLKDAYPPDFVERYVSAESQGRTFLQSCDQIVRLLERNDTEWAEMVTVFSSLADALVPNSDDDVECIDDLIGLLENTSEMRMSYRPAEDEEVNLLTYYKAKGLEFDVVFCLDAYEYIMPPFRYGEKSYDAYRQSLNLHYVGLTRARKVCYIPTATMRHNAKGRRLSANPSEFLFLDGLPERRRDVRWRVN